MGLVTTGATSDALEVAMYLTATFTSCQATNQRNSKPADT